MRDAEHSTNRTNLRAEQRFKLLDKISDDYKLIYREQAVISRTVTVGYNCGWLGLFGAALGLVYFIIKNPPIVQEPIDGIWSTLKPLTRTGSIIMLCAGLVMSVMLIVVCNTIPLRIYHNSTQKLYKAMFAYNILGKRKILTFCEGTAIPKFKWFLNETFFDINGHTTLLDAEHFPVPFVRQQMLHKPCKTK